MIKDWKKTEIILPASGTKSIVFTKNQREISLFKGHPKLIPPFTRDVWYTDVRTVFKGSHIPLGFSMWDTRNEAEKAIAKYMDDRK